MRVSFGLFFDFERTPKDEPHQREGSTDSQIERLPEEAELGVEDRVAPTSRPVVGFQARPLGRTT